MEENQEASEPIFTKEKLQEVLVFFKNYLRNPVEQVKSVPDWEWPLVLATLGGVSALSGVAEGIIHKSIIQIILSFIFVPIGSIILTAILSGFFYYTFFFFFNRELQFRQLYTGVFICSLPIYVFQILSAIASPFLLIGALAATFLLIVCFVEHFQLPRKRISQMMGGIFIVFFLLWVANVIEFAQQEKSMEKKYTPESLDILEKDLQNK